MGDHRIKPGWDGWVLPAVFWTAIENFADGTTNPWGLDWDDHGQMFITNCVIHHAFHVVPGGRADRPRRARAHLLHEHLVPQALGLGDLVVVPGVADGTVVPWKTLPAGQMFVPFTMISPSL